ncbi:MAG: SH3 domain-containing protein [Elusimicrobiota bacterium]
MKRSRIAGILSFFLALAPALANAGMFSVSAKKANVRSGPGTQYEVLWYIWKHEPLQSLRHSGPWTEVRDFEGYTGWIYSSLLSDYPSVVVIAKAANIRSGPSARFDIVWEVDRGVTFQVRSVKGRWIEVYDEGGDDAVTGWIHRSLVWGNLLLKEKEDEAYLDETMNRI